MHSGRFGLRSQSQCRQLVGCWMAPATAASLAGSNATAVMGTGARWLDLNGIGLPDGVQVLPYALATVVVISVAGFGARVIPAASRRSASVAGNPAIRQ